ncbi:MAG: hypothetical protein ACRDMH_12075 [Solirubrobacterales bacterium]
MAQLRSRLTYSNVTSTIALLIAVGGGTAYAVDHINADKVDGLNAAKLNFERPITVGPNPNFERVFDQGGLLIRARCGNQSGFFMDAQARTRVNNAEMQAVTTGAQNEQHEAIDRDFDKVDSVDLPLGSGAQGVGTLTYSTPAGSHVSLVFQADVGSILGDTKACLLGGTALHAPG